MQNHHVESQDDAKEPVSHLLWFRLPWLIVGLLGGIVTSVIVSNYEEILQQNVHLAFFIPVIVYLSDAVGTQTETIYVRQLKGRVSKFSKYFVKETLLGMSLGSIFGVSLGVFSYWWLSDWEVSVTVGLATFINVTIAPVLAVLIPTILAHEHTDPALGAGPFATIIQDLLTLLIYFAVASVIIL
jgi:magnesium transporter